MPVKRFCIIALFALLVTACGGSDSAEDSTDNSSTVGSGSSDSGATGSGGDSDTGSEDSGSDSTGTSTAITEPQCDSASNAQIDELICAIEAFVSTLDTTEAAATMYEWDNSQTERTTWSNLPTGNVSRNGIRLGALDDDSLTALHNVAQLLLSDDGYADFTGVLAADDYLQAQGGGSVYSADNYYVALFGLPSRSDNWMIQIGGHHLAYNVTFVEGTGFPVPNHIASEPKSSFELNSTSYAPLVQEGDAMVAMFESLSSAQLDAAYLSGESYSDVLMGPDDGSGVQPTYYPTGDERGGVLVSSLSEAQQALVIAAMSEWVMDYQSDISDQLLADYTSTEALADTYIAWAGSQNAGVDIDTAGTYLRIDGPRVWIELACQNGVVIHNQTHFHTMYRDKQWDYGNTL